MSDRHVWGLASLDDPIRLRTPQEERLLAWMNTDAQLSWVECCRGCPKYFVGYGVRERCCAVPEPQPSRWARIKRRFH
jgi:hypothetical protein